MNVECCIKSLVDFVIGNGLDTKQEAAIYMKNYLYSLGGLPFRIKRKDVAELCDAAINQKRLTKREKNMLLNKCLTFIYEK